ncbi:tRNA pseudouridine(38-40) synthase TruA [Rhodoferax sp.]|uniref:tRNA pseudouridine(38-40) synthase TruA n=1 Tax=Rhodoferax sp. TaxID=50421 RepID=UPI002620EA71|nr:tRNA pseudouridine(38-40) synthase TruA [Rhodoferax sp.]MDD2924148.1 tRNA pseudouridine(38-40) synthase TruA [Rhodoferax sp.]
MRLALGISYNGLAYQGWQSQPSGQTVQDKLEKALGEFSAQHVSTLCAGRTDAGVHGLMQVVHFDTSLDRAEASWVRGPNALLPHDIAVQWARSVPAKFHCRASALSRRYAYILLDSPVRPSIDTGRVGWVYKPLDLQRMQQAAGYLLGEHDFTSFRASACQALSPVKNLMRLDITRWGVYWRFEFEANAFLHHMIRNIMGCLIMVGDGRRSPEWVRGVLAACDRDAAAPTFSPHGLYFLGPRYAPIWGLPDHPSLLDGLPGAA